MGVEFYRDADVPFYELKLCDVGGLAYKKHTHEEYSIGVVDSGKSSFWCEGKTLEVNPRTIVMIPPGLVHSCNPDLKSRWKYKMLFVEENWLRLFLANRKIAAFHRPLVSDRSDYPVLHGLLKQLTAPASPLEKEAGILEFFEQALQGLESAGTRGGTELPKLRLIKEYLHGNYQKKITLAELEQVSGLNKFNIIRSFKEEFSIPPHTYQTLLRINLAKKLLRQERQIVEVVCETGFYDQSHFNKVFKSHTGVTPEKYRKLK
ncbi:AraC family transcriptional regulator [Sporomusa aerivorans]|uniref:AraC family transcriptional regulator n=1 Tax=Sporomusa aerivorans TaxID=204936 RepID=UPI00352B4328